METKFVNTIHVCYWLQGFVEISGAAVVSPEEWNTISKGIADVVIKQKLGNSQSDYFVCWLSGFVDINKSHTVTESQWNVIKEHLQLVFSKVTTKEVDLLKEKSPLEKAIDELNKNVLPRTDIWRSMPNEGRIDGNGRFPGDEKYCSNTTTAPMRGDTVDPAPMYDTNSPECWEVDRINNDK